MIRRQSVCIVPVKVSHFVPPCVCLAPEAEQIRFLICLQVCGENDVKLLINPFPVNAIL